ncbi:MAG: hypothetical protein ACJ8BW_13170 [Ktedonobacteraceae bacterium]
MRAPGQRTSVRLHGGSRLLGHRVLLSLRAGEPVFPFRGNGTPALLLGDPIGGEDIQHLPPAPQPKHVHVLSNRPAGKTVDCSMRVLVLEAAEQEPVLPSLQIGSGERTLHDGIDEWARPAPCSLVFPLGIQIPKLCLVLFLAQIIDQIVAVVADEDFVLLEGPDKGLHPARRRLNRQAGGVRRHDYSYLTFLHILKQSGKRLTALAKLLVIDEIPQLAIVRRRINRCPAVVRHVL